MGSLRRWGLWGSRPPLRNSCADYPLVEFLWAHSDRPPRRARAPQSPSVQGDPKTTVLTEVERNEEMFAPAGTGRGGESEEFSAWKTKNSAMHGAMR
jgi:hypothetical protein